jgi:hypothetical protein
VIIRLSSVVERLAVNENVAGSSPAAGANELIFKRLLRKSFVLLYFLI